MIDGSSSFPSTHWTQLRVVDGPPSDAQKEVLNGLIARSWKPVNATPVGGQAVPPRPANMGGPTRRSERPLPCSTLPPNIDLGNALLTCCHHSPRVVEAVMTAGPAEGICVSSKEGSGQTVGHGP
jgi:hypothetical protein